MQNIVPLHSRTYLRHHEKKNASVSLNTFSLVSSVHGNVVRERSVIFPMKM